MSEVAEVTRFQTYERPILIDDQGAHGVVYKISDTEVAKIAQTYPEIIKREMGMAKKLYSVGISVPEPRDWGLVRVCGEQEPKKAFIMEFVPGRMGIELFRIQSKKFREKWMLAQKLFVSELQKARELGFRPRDDTMWNYILTPTDEIKLIDFVMWNHPNIPDYINPKTVFADVSGKNE